MSRYQLVDVYKCTAADMCSIYLDGASFYPFATDDDGHSLRFVYNSMKFDSAGSVYTNNSTTIIIVVVTNAVIIILSCDYYSWFMIMMILLIIFIIYYIIDRLYVLFYLWKDLQIW